MPDIRLNISQKPSVLKKIFLEIFCDQNFLLLFLPKYAIYSMPKKSDNKLLGRKRSEKPVEKEWKKGLAKKYSEKRLDNGDKQW